MREVAAYLLDHKGMAGVPATGFVYAWSDSFQNTLPDTDGSTAAAQGTTTTPSPPRRLKQGSLQEFVRADGNRDGWGWPKFPTIEVQKIAVLDLRILNLDRNEENTLVQWNNGGKDCRLVPIDHGACLPELYNTVEAVNLEWRSSPQAKRPVEPELRQYIAQLDVERDVHLLRNVLNFKDTCVRMFRLAHVLLQRGVAAGMTLLDISNMLYPPVHNLQQELPFRNFWAAAHELAKNATLPTVSRHPALQRPRQPRRRGGGLALLQQDVTVCGTPAHSPTHPVTMGARGVNPDSVPPLPSTRGGSDIVFPASDAERVPLNVSPGSSSEQGGANAYIDSDASSRSSLGGLGGGGVHIPATPLQVALPIGPGASDAVQGEGWNSDADVLRTLDSSVLSALDSTHSHSVDSDGGNTPVAGFGRFVPFQSAATPVTGGPYTGAPASVKWHEQLSSITMTAATRAARSVAATRHEATADYHVSFRRDLPVDRLLPELSKEVLTKSGLVASVAVAYLRNRALLREFTARRKAAAAPQGQQTPSRAQPAHMAAPSHSAPPMASPPLVRMQSGGSTLGFLDHGRAPPSTPSALEHPTVGTPSAASATEGSASEAGDPLNQCVITAVTAVVSWGGYLTLAAFAPAEPGEYFEGHDETEECLAQALASAIVTAAEAPVAHDRTPLFREHVPQEFLLEAPEEGGLPQLPEGGLSSSQLTRYSAQVPPRCSLPASSPFTGAASLDATLQQAVLKAIGRLSPPAESVLGKEMGWRHSNTGSSDAVDTPVGVSPLNPPLIPPSRVLHLPGELGRPSPAGDSTSSPKPTTLPGRTGAGMSPLAGASDPPPLAGMPLGLSLDGKQHPGVQGNHSMGGTSVGGRHLTVTPGGASVASTGTAATLGTPRLGPQGEPVPQSGRRSVLRGGNAEHLRQRQQHRSYLRAARRAIRAESAGGLGEARRGGMDPVSAQDSGGSEAKSPSQGVGMFDSDDSPGGVLSTLRPLTDEEVGAGGSAGGGGSGSSIARDIRRQLQDASKRDLPQHAMTFLHIMQRGRRRAEASQAETHRLRSRSVVSAAEAMRRRRAHSIDISRPTAVHAGQSPTRAPINAPPPAQLLQSALLGSASSPNKPPLSTSAASRGGLAASNRPTTASFGSSDDSSARGKGSVQPSPTHGAIVGQAVGVWTSCHVSPLMVASLPASTGVSGSAGHLPRNPMEAGGAVQGGGVHSPQPEPMSSDVLSPSLPSNVSLPATQPVLRHAATFGGHSRLAQTARSVTGHMALHTQSSFGFRDSPQGMSLFPGSFSASVADGSQASGGASSNTSNNGTAPFKLQSRQLHRTTSAALPGDAAPVLAPPAQSRGFSAGHPVSSADMHRRSMEPLFPSMALQSDSYYRERNAPHANAAPQLSPVYERGSPAGSDASAPLPRTGLIARSFSDGQVSPGVTQGAGGTSALGTPGAASFVAFLTNFSDAPQMSSDAQPDTIDTHIPTPEFAPLAGPSFGHFGLRDGTSPYLGPANPSPLGSLLATASSPHAFPAPATKALLSPLTSSATVPAPSTAASELVAPVGGGLKRVGKLGQLGGGLGCSTLDGTAPAYGTFGAPAALEPASPPLVSADSTQRREGLAGRIAGTLATPPRSAGDSLQGEEGGGAFTPAYGSPGRRGVPGLPLGASASHHLDLSVAVCGPIPCFADPGSGTAGMQQALFYAQAQGLELGSYIATCQPLGDAPGSLSIGLAAMAPMDLSAPAVRQLTPSKPPRSGATLHSPKAPASSAGDSASHSASALTIASFLGGATTGAGRDSQQQAVAPPAGSDREASSAISLPVGTMQSNDTPPVDSDSQGTGTPVHLERSAASEAELGPRVGSVLSALGAAAAGKSTSDTGDSSDATSKGAGKDPFKTLHKASQPWRPSFMRGGASGSEGGGSAAVDVSPAKSEKSSSPIKLQDGKESGTPNLGPAPVHVPGMARADSYVALGVGTEEAGGAMHPPHTGHLRGGAAHGHTSGSGSDFDEVYSRDTSRGLTPRGDSGLPTAFSLMRANTFSHDMNSFGTGTSVGRSSSNRRRAGGHGGAMLPAGGGVSLGLTRATHTMHAALQAPHSRVLTDEPSPSRVSQAGSDSASLRPSALNTLRPGGFASGLATTANTPVAAQADALAASGGMSALHAMSARRNSVERIDSPYMSLFLHFFDSQVEMYVQSWRQRQDKAAAAAAAAQS